MKFLPLREYNFLRLEKLQTYHILNSINCPVLKSVLIEDSDILTDSILNLIKNHLNSNFCTVRYQYIVATNKPIRGGNTVRICKKEINSQKVSGAMLWLLEPTNRLTNKYGINMFFNRCNEKLVFECVGRGFDTSDINRGNMSPHQTIEFRLPFEYGWNMEWWKYGKFDFISKDRFIESKYIRKKNLNYLGYENISNKIFDLYYIPLSLSQLELLIKYAKVIYDCEELKNEKDFVVNCSIFEDNRLIFWDIATPLGKMSILIGG